jgi:hypothetical protein
MNLNLYFEKTLKFVETPVDMNRIRFYMAHYNIKSPVDGVNVLVLGSTDIVTLIKNDVIIFSTPELKNAMLDMLDFDNGCVARHVKTCGVLLYNGDVAVPSDTYTYLKSMGYENAYHYLCNAYNNQAILENRKISPLYMKVDAPLDINLSIVRER